MHTIDAASNAARTVSWRRRECWYTFSGRRLASRPPWCQWASDATSTFLSDSNSSMHLPEPKATECSGSSGHVDRHAGLVLEPLVEAAEQGPAAGEHDALVHDVGGQLGRGAVQGVLDGVDDLVDRLLDRLADLCGADGDRLGQAADQVAAADVGGRLLGQGERRAEVDLDLLGGPLAQHQRVLLLDVADDRLVQLVAADADALAGDDAAEGDHGHLGGAPADVDHHVPGRLVDGQADADRGRHRLLDDEGAAGAGPVGGLDHGPPLDPGDARGHAHHHPGLGHELAAVHLVDEVAEHLLGGVEVGDDPVLERADGHDVAGGPADHRLGLGADGQDGVVLGVDGHDRGLVEHDPAAADVDEGVGGSEVDGHVAAEEAEGVLQARPAPSSVAWIYGGVADAPLEPGHPTPSPRTTQERSGYSWGKNRPSSRAADSGESEPWTRFFSISRP